MTHGSATVMAVSNYDDKATGSAVMGFLTMSITLIAGSFYLVSQHTQWLCQYVLWWS